MLSISLNAQMPFWVFSSNAILSKKSCFIYQITLMHIIVSNICLWFYTLALTRIGNYVFIYDYWTNAFLLSHLGFMGAGTVWFSQFLALNVLKGTWQSFGNNCWINRWISKIFCRFYLPNSFPLNVLFQ